MRTDHWIQPNKWPSTSSLPASLTQHMPSGPTSTRAGGAEYETRSYPKVRLVFAESEQEPSSKRSRQTVSAGHVMRETIDNPITSGESAPPPNLSKESMPSRPPPKKMWKQMAQAQASPPDEMVGTTPAQLQFPEAPRQSLQMDQTLQPQPPPFPPQLPPSAGMGSCEESGSVSMHGQGASEELRKDLGDIAKVRLLLKGQRVLLLPSGLIGGASRGDVGGSSGAVGKATVPRRQAMTPCELTHAITLRGAQLTWAVLKGYKTLGGLASPPRLPACLCC